MSSSEKYVVIRIIVDMMRGAKIIAEKLGNVSRILRMYLWTSAVTFFGRNSKRLS